MAQIDFIKTELQQVDHILRTNCNRYTTMAQIDFIKTELQQGRSYGPYRLY